MKPLAAFAHGAWLAASLPAWRRFRRALPHPAETQRQLLQRTVTANATSAYGQAHHFDQIRDYADFRARVPIVDYDNLAPWIERLTRGQQGILTSAPVTRLVPTSGSTSGRKLIPFTTGLQQEFTAAVAPWIVDLFSQHPAAIGGVAYWSISPALPPSSNDPKSAIPIGFDDDSAYLGRIQQRLAATTFAVPSVLRHVADHKCARYLTLLSLLRARELRLVSVWHPSFFALLLDALPVWWEELLADLADGSCRRAAGLPASIRAAFDDVTPQPGRANSLRRAGPSDVSALWPRLCVVSCWGDGQAGLAIADLRRRLPHLAVQSKGLLATEACVSIPFAGRHPLAVTSHFFEFEDTRGNIHLVDALRPGQTYSVIVTTGGGLWRYRLGDLVEVDGFVGATPSLRFLGRGASVSDLRGEKLAEAFVTQAIAAACAASACAPAFALLAPEQNGGAPRYALFVEGPTPAELLGKLETELRRNPHYAYCRDLGQLGPLHCRPVARGAYRVFTEALMAGGKRLGDIKPQSLSMHTDWEIRFRASEQREPGGGP